jgi:ribose 5-phosphate isomerase A
MTIFERALEFVSESSVVGLGSGRASTEFIKILGERVRAGFHVHGVATSGESESLARKLGIPLVTLEERLPIDVTVDGADEVDAQLNLIKGYGRALVREKIVALASQKLVILVGPGKEVNVLGERSKLPIEVIPFALPLTRRYLSDMGLQPVLYEKDNGRFLTDNGNYILDCRIPRLEDPAEFQNRLRAVPGVVDTGLFIGIADTVLFGDENFNLINQRRRSG